VTLTLIGSRPWSVSTPASEHRRRRKLGRIVIRAISAFLDGGGRKEDLHKLELAAIGWGLGLYDLTDPLGYSAVRHEVIELTSEVLTDTRKLVHPDHQPPERRELAQRVTQRLLALQPFVFPAPKPRPAAIWPSAGPSVGVTVNQKVRAEPLKEPLRYPCEKCAADVPYFYCSAATAGTLFRSGEARGRAPHGSYRSASRGAKKGDTGRDTQVIF
jgi:hypothetical protein